MADGLVSFLHPLARWAIPLGLRTLLVSIATRLRAVKGRRKENLPGEAWAALLFGTIHGPLLAKGATPQIAERRGWSPRVAQQVVGREVPVCRLFCRATGVSLGIWRLYPQD